jgi:hypothetical protein
VITAVDFRDGRTRSRFFDTIDYYPEDTYEDGSISVWLGAI